MFWGMSFVWTRQLLNFFSPVTVVTLRLALATLFLIPFSFAIRKLQKIKWSDLKYFILLSFFEPFIYFIFEGYGIKSTSASFAAIVIATVPLFTPLGERIFFKQRMSLLNFIGVTISFGGVALIILTNSNHTVFNFWGLLILLGAVFSAVGYFLSLKNLTQKYNAFSITAWQNFFGVVFFLPIFLSFSLGEFKGLDISYGIVSPLVFLAVLASSLAFIFNTYGVRELGAGKAAAFTNSVPVFTTIFSFFVLNEAIGVSKIIGISIVITGVALAQSAKAKAKTQVGILG